MSGLDPLAAALAAQAAAGAQAAMDQAMLSIGADIAVLQAQISVGDVIAATVLPPQGGTDLLSFLGQTVPAQLPPGVNPGESLLLQVTSFTNNAVIVRNLGIADPQNPVPVVDVELPPQAPGAPQTAVLTTTLPLPRAAAAAPPPPQTSAPQAPPPNIAPPQTPPSNIAPPRSVFVAASVRAAPPAPVPPEALDRADAAVQASAANSDLEARIAAIRAGSTAAPQPPPAAQAEAPPSSSPPPPPPQATFGRLPVTPPIVLDAARRSAPGEPAPLQNQPASVQPREPETPEAALLARLRVPVTPSTLAAARVVQNATSTLTNAYEKLDALLARMPSSQVPAALRSTLGFVARMDLRSAALPDQIAAFVSDVLDGAEAKLAQTIRAWLPISSPEPEIAVPQPPGAPPGPPPPAAAQSPSAPSSAPASAQPNAAAVTNATAQASERAIALEYDPKTAMLSMLQEQAPATASPGAAPVAAALHDALVATTAVQLGALSAQNSDPSAIVLSLPAYYYEGGAPVQLRISRDAPESKKKLDADNFHIAFVLDTESLGTVAVDVQTVGRAVSVDVKTQASLAAERFRGSFSDLRARFERLRYRIANINAGVASAPASAQPSEPANEPPPARRSFWDMRA